MERLNVNVTVLDASEYDDNFPFRYDRPGRKLADAISALQALLEQIPAEYRESAEVQIGSEGDYDSDRAYIRITYSRPETDEEMERRLTKDHERVEAKRQLELAVLAELQAKYGATEPTPVSSQDNAPLK